MNRVLQRFGTAAALWLFGSTLSYCAYLESDANAEDRARPARPPEVVRPVPPPRVDSNPVTDLVRRIEVGSPYRYGGLTVFPLILKRVGSTDDIRTLDEALRNDWIMVEEKENAQVNDLHVRNDSRHMVFLMAGEILAGGRQNRIVREDVLLPALSGLVDIPVYCVEQERWAGKTGIFSSPSSMVDQGIRKSAVAGEPQDSIWRQAAAKSESVGVSSRTRNYQEIYEDKDVKRRIDVAASRLDRIARRDTIGAVAVLGDRIVSCDMFSDPDIFSRLWGKLCRSYALEDVSAVDDNSGRWHDYSTSVTAGDVERFISDIIHANYDYRSTPGAGHVVQISGGVTGVAIIWDGAAVHVTVFPGSRPTPVLYRRGVIVE